jgi:hypothetical protein
MQQFTVLSASCMDSLLDYLDWLMGWATRDNPEDIDTLCVFISQ